MSDEKYVLVGFNNNDINGDINIIKQIPFSLASRSGTIKNMLSDYNLIELDNIGNIKNIEEPVDELYHLFLPQNYITEELIDQLIKWDDIILNSSNNDLNNEIDTKSNNSNASSFIILENIDFYKHTINNLFQNSNSEEFNFIINLDEHIRNNLIELVEHLEINEFSDKLASYYALDIIKILKEKNYELFKTKYNFINEYNEVNKPSEINEKNNEQVNEQD